MSGGTLEAIARMLGEALSPLEQRLAAGEAENFFADLGLSLPPGLLPPAALQATAGGAAQLPPAVAALVTAMQGGDGLDIALKGAELAQKAGQVLTGISGIATALAQAAQGGGLPPAQKAAVAAFAAELPGRLVGFLLFEWVERKSPDLAGYLALAGILDRAIDAGDDGVLPPTLRKDVRFDRIGALFQDPRRHFRELYGFGDAAFDGKVLFQRVKDLVDRPGIEALLLTPPGQPAVLESYVFRLAVDRTQNPPALSALLRVPAKADVPFDGRLSPLWSLVGATKSRFDGGLAVTISPNGAIDARPSAGPATLDVEFGLKAQDPAGPIVLLGEANGSRIALESFSAKALIGATAGSQGLKVDLGVAAEIAGGKAVIDTSKGDGFLRFLTGGVKGEADISLSATWKPDGGLKIDGSSALEIAIPAHATIGPVTLATIYLRAGLEAGPTIPVELSAAISGSLGPLSVSVDRIGARLTFTFPEHGGNLGPIHLDAGFKPPNGIGLAIDGGGFTGGGFLYLDVEKGEYAGALELSFQGIVDVKAVGILNTRMPDGSGGFSLLILISAEFAPIQLSFGFTLIGVGGLLGLNRTILFDPLRQGVRDGSLNSVLFPQDVVANAPRIINDLKRIFPPLEDRFLIGPMAKIGWGTPTLVSLELGLLLEIPRPAFAIAGVLRLALPTVELPIVNIQVNFLGTVDFEKGQLAFDAALYDSRVLTMPLTGDMAVRVYWGENANFLLTVGGFHPAYSPPPGMGLGDLSRLGITICQPNPRIRAEAYFAVTSNTAQFGAKVELYAGIDIFNVYGFLSLDALIQFDPFQFTVDVAGMLAVRSGSKVLFGVRLSLTLTGPSPWRARGRASFEISFIFTISFTVKFDVTVGEKRDTSLPPVSVLPLLVEALNKDEAWRALPATAHSGQVSLRDFSAEAALVLDPAGALQLAQKIVPLNLPLDHFGARKLSGGKQFSLTELKLGGELAETEGVREQFAPAQFLAMNDAQKLSSASFARYDGGIAAKGGSMPFASFVRRVEIAYEVIYLNRPRALILFKLPKGVQDAVLRAGAAARSALSGLKRKPTGLGTAKVTLGEGGFVVAGVKDLAVVSGTGRFATQAEADAAFKALVANDATLSGRIQVVQAYEVAA